MEILKPYLNAIIRTAKPRQRCLLKPPPNMQVQKTNSTSTLTFAKLQTKKTTLVGQNKLSLHKHFMQMTTGSHQNIILTLMAVYCNTCALIQSLSLSPCIPHNSLGDNEHSGHAFGLSTRLHVLSSPSVS